MKNLIALDWKNFKRSPEYKKRILVLIFLSIFTLGAIGLANILGAGSYFLIKNNTSFSTPFEYLNHYLLFWWLGDLVFRYYMQKMPVLHVLPLMNTPYRKETLVNYILLKNLLFFGNFIYLFLLLSFTITGIWNGVSPFMMLNWIILPFSILTINNFLIFILNKQEILLASLSVLIAGLIGLEYYDYLQISPFFAKIFNTFLTYPIISLIPIGLSVLMVTSTQKFIRNEFYLDGKFKEKQKNIETSNLNWLNFLGSMAPFIKNDLKLIWRNKKPRKLVWASLFWVVYAFVFKTSFKENLDYSVFFVSMFITGSFSLSFGQLVPAWDSEYYKLMMSQNIPYRTFLNSKWLIMTVSNFVLFFLVTPMLFLSPKIYSIIFAIFIYNVGMDNILALIIGSMNRTPINLNTRTKSFSNSSSFNLPAFLIGLLRIIIPASIFLLSINQFNLKVGLIAISTVGILGLFFKGLFLTKIEKIYKKNKYETIHSFSQIIE